MELERTTGGYALKKALTALDTFTLEFTAILDALDLRYVLVGGYLAILFGRSRSSEDIDLFLAPQTPTEFRRLWTALVTAGWWCLNTDDPADAYHAYLAAHVPIRFAHADQTLPNMEVKFPRIALDSWALENRQPVQLNDRTIWIAPHELGIAYKLYMGSDKDIEDARHLYTLLTPYLDEKLLASFARKLQIPDRLGVLR